MVKEAYTIVGVEVREGVGEYICTNDTGTIRRVTLETLKVILERKPGSFRNTTLEDVELGTIGVPEVEDGLYTIVYYGKRGRQNVYYVVVREAGVWETKYIKSKELKELISSGKVWNARALQDKVKTRAPANKELLDKNYIDESKQGKEVKKVLSIEVLYITEAYNDKGEKLRYGGVEFSDVPEEMMEFRQALRQQSLLFRQKYLEFVGQADESLEMLEAVDAFYVVLPYEFIKALLDQGNYVIRLTKVAISAVIFRKRYVSSEAKTTLNSILGYGTIQGDQGEVTKYVEELRTEILGVFKEYKKTQSGKKR